MAIRGAAGIREMARWTVTAMTAEITAVFATGKIGNRILSRCAAASQSAREKNVCVLHSPRPRQWHRILE